jgi:hypothetical protein
MNHLSEDEFVSLYYGDDRSPEIQQLESHVAACAECRKELQRLTAFLGAIHIPIPEPARDYEDEVWRRLRPMLPDATGKPARWFGPWKWAAAVAMAALVFAAFSVGRWFERSAEVANANMPVRNVSGDSLQMASRERALLLAVGGHLERAQFMLIELGNTAPSPTMDISSERDAAQALLPDNRLYRETATQLADVQIATLLDELERLLLDLSHRPAMISRADFDEIRDRIETQGILFKVRIAGSELRSRQAKTIDRPHLLGSAGL